MQYASEKHEAVFACFISASFSVASIFYCLASYFTAQKRKAIGMFVIIVCFKVLWQITCFT